MVKYYLLNKNNVMYNKIMEERIFIHYKGVNVLVIKGDITEETTDAIVNPANSYLKHGGGVAGAIVRKGGYEIQEESNKIGYVSVGEVAVTSAGKLKAKYIIHAVGPRWGEGDEDRKLESAVFNSLKKADELKLNSISLPAISTGIFGFPKERGAFIILSTIKKFIEENEGKTSIKEIHCTNIDEETTKIFEEKIKQIFGG